MKKLNKQHPEQYVMVTAEFGAPVYIAPLKGGEIQITDGKEQAERWSYADTLSSKLAYHKAVTGYTNLKFERE